MKKHACTKRTITKHAYGSKVQTKWNGGDYATAGLDTAGGALGGMATGAALGTIGGPIGVVAGGVIGGLIGLGKGILGSSAKAKQRAQLKEANRQQTIQNMDSRLAADANQNTYTMTSPSFYLRGGRIHMNGSSIPGMRPIASDSQLAIGPSHENGGIPYGPNDEIEGGETTMQKPTETLVFSDRLKVPGTNKTFAKLSYPLMIEKGKIEKEFESILKSSEKEVEILNNPTNSKVKRNSSIRRGEINTLRSSEKLAKINAINIVLENLFKVQEQVNGNEQESEDGVDKHWDGRTIPFDTNAFVTDDFKSKVSAIPTLPARVSQPGTLVDTSNLQKMSPKLVGSGDASGFKVNGTALQYGADALDTISQAISSYQMSKLPLPNRAMMPRMRFDTYVDNSRDIADIESNRASTKKFIESNVRNPQIRRAMMIDLATKVNAAKSTSYFNKLTTERQLEAKNTELAFNTIMQNNNASFQNAVDKFNQNTATYTRNSQIAANFADKIGQVGLNKERQDMQYLSLGMMLSQYPEDVRKAMIRNIQNGKSIKQSIFS